MNYLVRHRTTYSYGQEVAYSRLIAHLAPRATPRQHTREFELTLDPAPAYSIQRPDFFGNPADWFTIDESHTALEILAESQVVVEPAPVLAAEASPSWEAVREALET